MTIAASARKILPTRADLLAVTAALAQITARGPQLDQSSPINKTALDCIYLFTSRRSINQPIRSTRRPSDRPVPKSKSP